MKPLIAVSCSLRGSENEVVVRQEYLDAVYQSGGLSLIIPVSQDEMFLDEMVEKCAGLLLTGGGDVDPLFYKAVEFGGSRDVDWQRDCYEFKLLEIAERHGKPVLAICRGMQVLNVYFQGTLYEDLKIASFRTVLHQPEPGWGTVYHWVRFKPGTRLYKILGEQQLVNSNHHQAVRETGFGLEPSGNCIDGVVEAIEGKSDWWTIGVQWHPERLKEDYAMPELFTEFVRVCREGMA